MLDMKYVEENVLTNTDRFLEEHITGSFRTWHVILIASTILTVTGKKAFLNMKVMCVN